MSKIYYDLKRPHFSAISKERLSMSKDMFEILTVVLNKIHKTSYSPRFWKILTAPYVGAIIGNRDVLNEDDINIELSTYAHSDMFKPNKKNFGYERIRHIYTLITSMGSYKRIRYQLKSGNNIGVGFNYPKAISSEVDVFMDAHYPILSNKKINHKKRNISIENSGKYSGTFISNIVNHIPKVYIEYFDYLTNRVPLYEPEKKIFHVSTIGNLFLRFTLANYIAHGAKLKYYQHGGFYGEFKHHNAHDYESSIADQFMTWGWKIKDNDVPSSAYRLEKLKENFNNQIKKSFDLLLIYPSIYHINNEHFDRISRLFFNKINRVKFAKICARPRPKSTFNRKADLKFIVKKAIKIDSGFTPLSKLISKSKLVILMNHPSTTILECLYIDQPVVALLDNDDPSEIIIPYYDFLLEKKLLHLTIDSLIDHLNTTNIDAWWSALLKDPTYLQFKHEFLRKV